MPGLPPWEVSAVSPERAPRHVRLSADENWTFYRSDGPPAEPPQYLLEWGFLAQQIVEAWQRDLATGSAEAETALRRFRPGEPGELHWRWIILCVERALSLVRWRSAAFIPIPMPEVPPDADYDTIGRLAEQHQAAVRAARPSHEAMGSFAHAGAEAVREILRPWLDGKRNVNYEALVDALQWFQAGGATRPPRAPEARPSGTPAKPRRPKARKKKGQGESPVKAK